MSSEPIAASVPSWKQVRHDAALHLFREDRGNA
jgi:hypothetical protein